MTIRTRSAIVETTLGTLGLFLLLVVTRLADAEAVQGTTATQRTQRAMARGGLALVSAVGTTVDALAGSRQASATTARRSDVNLTGVPALRRS